MISAVQFLQRQQSITVSDAAYLIRRKDGGLPLKHTVWLVSVHWVVYSGIVGRPAHHVALADRVCSKIQGCGPLPDADCGVDGDFLSQVSHAIKPGYSALFMLVVYLTEETVAELSDTMSHSCTLP